MNARAARILRVPFTVGVIWLALAVAIPTAMTQFFPFVLRPGVTCVTGTQIAAGASRLACRSLAEIYQRSFFDLFADGMFRSLALLIGAAVLALVVGTLVGVAGAMLRRHAIGAGAIVGLTTLLTAVPAFFVAYFLQIFVILVGATPEGDRLLPVFGFGYDEHLVLPLLSISIPAVAYTAQLTATRMTDVLDADFVTTANAKGLRTGWILVVHVLPHVRPVLLEALGSGLRVSVASLPIVEFLFLWGGIGQLALEAVSVRDASGFIFSAVVLAALFATLSAIADLSRPRALYQPS
jgi:peptide/nickel transport system permease protein